MENIRNFVIIAHVDHGKSTLADRFLELTGAVPMRKMREQYLDMHPLEREKGITIKMAPVRMEYEKYILNLIDTPGHADFSYEVSRALAAVEGAILLVDATQGIQAQTLANLRLAQEENLAVIPVINKIDLPSAQIGKTEEELCAALGVAPGEILKISARTGEGAEELLRAVIERVPPPDAQIPNYRPIDVSSARNEQPLRALVFDSKYEPYLGIVAHVRIRSGSVKKGDAIRFIATEADASAADIGLLAPDRAPTDELSAGEIGYIATGIKEPERVRVGDTVTHADTGKHLNVETLKSFALPGYREPVPLVWASVFPENQDDYESLRDGLKKLRLEDAALTFAPEAAGVLGRSFRAGFLGMLHMEIVAERIKREYALGVVFSRPSVLFRVTARTGPGGTAEEMPVYGAHMLPATDLIERIEEPWVTLEILAPAEFLGPLTALIHSRGGRVTETASRGHDQIHISCAAPLREIVLDFADTLKSATHGYGSMAYEPAGWRVADLVRLEIMVAGEPVAALSEIVPRDRAYALARTRVEKLKDILPARLFAISLQAAVEGRIIARETISALKKDVTAHMYGGDRTRKMKLWKKQQKGKKRLQEGARVDISPEVFFKILSR